MSTLALSTIESLSGNTAMTVHSSGVPLLNVPMFLMRLSSNQNITSGTSATLILDDVILNTNNWYNTTTGIFAPTVAGYYQINGTISYRAASGMSRMIARLEDENGTYTDGADVAPPASTVGRVSFSTIRYFNGTTNTTQLSYYTLATSPVIDSDLTSFSGFLVRGA